MDAPPARAQARSDARKLVSHRIVCAPQPQFDDVKERTIEAYICHDFGGRDFYGQPMRLLICAFLRPQAKFEDFDALIEAITTDVAFGQEALDTPTLRALRDDSFFSEVSAADPAPADEPDAEPAEK